MGGLRREKGLFLEVLRRWCSQYLLYTAVLFWQVRFVQKDNISLSPNYQRDSCHLTLCIHNAAEGDRLRYFLGLFDRFTTRGFKPRVHWGKYFNLSGTTISDLLPDVKNFLKNRQRLDPNNIFLNRLLSETLGILWILHCQHFAYNYFLPDMLL